MQIFRLPGPARWKTNSDDLPHGSNSEIPRHPILRAKTGCYTCKRRHIKCGEERPRCENCAKLSLRCIWGKPPASSSLTQSSDGDIPIRVVPALLSYQVGCLANGWHSFKDQNHFNLAMSCPKLTVSCLSAPELSAFAVEVAMTSLVLGERDVREPMAAFAASMVAKNEKKLAPVAIKYYTAGVERLRYLIDIEGDRTQTLVKMTMMYFLGLTEVLGRENYCTAGLHFKAMLSLYQTYLDQPSEIQPPFKFDLIPQIVNFAVVFVCEAAVFASNIDDFYHNLNWGLLWRHLTKQRRKVIQNHHLLGAFELFQRIHIFALEASYLCRRALTDQDSREKSKSMIQEVIHWEEQAITSSSGATLSTNFQVLLRFIRALVGAVLIHLTKAITPGACSSHEEIQNLVNERLPYVLEYSTFSRPFKVSLTKNIHYEFPSVYPALVLACASRNMDSFEDLAAKMGSLRGFKSGPENPGVSSVITMIRSRKNNPRAACTLNSGIRCNGVHDGMDLLLKGFGLSGKGS